MPQKQTQSETLSLPQLLQLAGIGGQPQQDTTREALGYMMGQQRLASEDADRKAKESQFQQDLELRRKALEQQSANADATGLFHAFSSEADPTRRALLFGAIAEKYPSIGKALAGQQAAEAQQRAVAQAQADVLAGGNKAQTGADTMGQNLSAFLGGLVPSMPTLESFTSQFQDKTPIFNPAKEQANQAVLDKEKQFQAALQWMAENSGVAPRDTSLDYLLKTSKQYTGQASPVRQPKL